MRRDRDKTWLKISVKTETRPRVSVSFFTRLRREPSFNEENDWILAFLFLKITHPNQDKMRLSKIEANETRPRWDCLKFFQTVSSRSSFLLSLFGLVLIWMCSFKNKWSQYSIIFFIKRWFSSWSRKKRHQDPQSRLCLA